MAWINCGVRWANGLTIPTKKALKAALVSPLAVEFYETSLGREHLTYTANSLPAGAKMQVVGPDPYRSRKWYATVEVKGGAARVTG